MPRDEVASAASVSAPGLTNSDNKQLKLVGDLFGVSRPLFAARLDSWPKNDQ
jgi:hypothetical protein